LPACAGVAELPASAGAAKLPASAGVANGLLAMMAAPSSRKDQPDALEFHLAWEIEFTNAPIKLAYVDALTGEVVATE